MISIEEDLRNRIAELERQLAEAMTLLRAVRNVIGNEPDLLALIDDKLLWG